MPLNVSIVYHLRSCMYIWLLDYLVGKSVIYISECNHIAYSLSGWVLQLLTTDDFKTIVLVNLHSFSFEGDGGFS